MPHNFLEGLECSWTLIRETASSQHFRVNDTEEDVDYVLDVHYTPPPNLLVTVAVIATTSSKSSLAPVLNDLAKVALRRGAYVVIDYTLLEEVRSPADGNFAII